jgi:hypothetical protein
MRAFPVDTIGFQGMSIDLLPKKYTSNQGSFEGKLPAYWQCQFQQWNVVLIILEK